MSEIIFPSEVLPEINTENPIAIKLIGLGVGIYLTTDNLTTVTNIVDDSVGIATDITNNELGVASGNYRVGADVSGLTAQEQTEINANPYQLFATQEVVEQEYYLKLGQSESSILDIHGLDDSSNSIHVEFKLATDFSELGSNDYIFEGRRKADGSTSRSGLPYILYSSGTPTVVTAWVDNLKLNGNAATNDGVAQAQAGDIISFDTTESTNGSIAFGARYSLSLGGGAKYGIHWIKVTDDSELHWFDCNQTRGKYVKSLTSNLQAELVGFDDDAGYVRGDEGELVGYQIGGSTTITLPFVGAYAGTLTYVDDTTLALSGSGNLVLDSTHIKAIKSVVATDSANNFDFDFTQGDQERLVSSTMQPVIPETINGLHAVINSVPTSGFLPVVDVDVFTIGAGKDFADLATHRSARMNINDNVNRLLITENLVLSAEVRYFSGEFSKVIYEALDMKFSGKFSDAENRLITDDGVMTTTLFQFASILEVRGIEFHNTVDRCFYLDSNAELIVSDCGITSDTSYGLFQTTGKTTANNSVIYAPLSYGIYEGGSNAVWTITNNIIVGNKQNYGAVRNRYSDNFTMYNNIVKNLYGDDAIVSDSGAEIEGVGNITEDSTASDLGVGTGNVNFTGAFVDG